ncbi:helix-turn-helix domain-containing protein [Enterococcus sp. AZ177]|uniref:helix-turn-helix domain-containing protein n=1 Tax=unclassified Enterococcus TaxID=2608891 RepID=UPI003D2FBB09
MKTNTAARLKQIMSERNLKQVDILNMSKPYQEKLGIKLSKSHLSQYVNGKSSPDQYKLYLLAETLGVNEAWLMGYDTSKDREEKIKAFQEEISNIDNVVLANLLLDDENKYTSVINKITKLSPEQLKAVEYLLDSFVK